MLSFSIANFRHFLKEEKDGGPFQLDLSIGSDQADPPAAAAVDDDDFLSSSPESLVAKKIETATTVTRSRTATTMPTTLSVLGTFMTKVAFKPSFFFEFLSLMKVA